MRKIREEFQFALFGMGEENRGRKESWFYFSPLVVSPFWRENREQREENYIVYVILYLCTRYLCIQTIVLNLCFL